MAGPAPFEQFVPRLRELFEQHRDPARAAAMCAYMRNQFPFMGIPSPKQKELTRQAIAGLAKPTQADLTVLSHALWAMDQREYQYVAVAQMVTNVRVCDASFLPQVHWLITTKPWWDAVDALAARVVGPLVAGFPELRWEMDDWTGSENPWLARTAILHQLGYKERTDQDRLFGYCRQRSGDQDFFIRKAIGWALREYSKTDGAAVRSFVAANPELSPLSQREALLWLNGGRKPPSAQPTAARDTSEACATQVAL